MFSKIKALLWYLLNCLQQQCSNSNNKIKWLIFMTTLWIHDVFRKSSTNNFFIISSNSILWAFLSITNHINTCEMLFSIGLIPKYICKYSIYSMYYLVSEKSIYISHNSKVPFGHSTTTSYQSSVDITKIWTLRCCLFWHQLFFKIRRKKDKHGKKLLYLEIWRREKMYFSVYCTFHAFTTWKMNDLLVYVSSLELVYMFVVLLLTKTESQNSWGKRESRAKYYRQEIDRAGQWLNYFYYIYDFLIISRCPLQHLHWWIR